MKTSVKTRSQSVPASARPPVPVRPPFTSFSTAPPTPGSIKKGIYFQTMRVILMRVGVSVPMNKIVVGTTPSPNLRKTSSKIGSLANSSHTPGGGQVKIENRKLDWNVSARTVNVNAGYVPTGGDKKVRSVLLDVIVTSLL